MVYTAGLIKVFNDCFPKENLQTLEERRHQLDAQITTAQNLKNKTTSQETRSAITENSKS